MVISGHYLSIEPLQPQCEEKELWEVTCKTTSMHSHPPISMAWGAGHSEVAHPELAFEFTSFLLDSKLFFRVVMENLSLDCVALLLS